MSPAAGIRLDATVRARDVALDVTLPARCCTAVVGALSARFNRPVTA